MARVDFSSVAPRSGLALYCDPPYAGTTGYGAVSDFDSARFWARAQEWACAGSEVYVSEYACPVPHDLVWERQHHLYVSPTAYNRKTTIERLFRVKPAPRAPRHPAPAVATLAP